MDEQRKRQRFEELAMPHLDAAYNLARWLARNDHDAQDVTQEAYLRAFRFFDGFTGSDAKSWLLTIVRNTYFSWRQRNRERLHGETFDEEAHGSYVEEADEAPRTDRMSPESLTLQSERAHALVDALERLPAELREALVLRELEGMSYLEIAAIVSAPIGTVMSRLSRARTRLREALNPAGKESYDGMP